jgi:hypothetical protein
LFMIVPWIALNLIFPSLIAFSSSLTLSLISGTISGIYAMPHFSAVSSRNCLVKSGMMRLILPLPE